MKLADINWLELLKYVAIPVAVVSMALTWYYNHRREQREQRKEAADVDEKERQQRRAVSADFKALKKSEDEIEEKRVKARPAIKLRQTGTEEMMKHFEISNDGEQAEGIEIIQITGAFTIPYGLKNKMRNGDKHSIMFNVKDRSQEGTVVLRYRDIYGNEYEQEHRMPANGHGIDSQEPTLKKKAKGK